VPAIKQMAYDYEGDLVDGCEDSRPVAARPWPALKRLLGSLAQGDQYLDFLWWRGLDLNQRPLGYETDTVRPVGYDS
jgi:hypothetical protein